MTEVVELVNKINYGFKYANLYNFEFIITE
jgi:hypothetical protein